MTQITIEILGSGGASTIPRAFCDCPTCVQARQKGLPYSRSGPSVFIHGPNILFDTPEEIQIQLNRAGIKKVDAAFYSHWHPDHTAGCRIWECNWRTRPTSGVLRTTPIYLPEQVVQDFKAWQGLEGKFSFFEKKGFIQQHFLSDGDVVDLKDITIKPFRLAEDYAYGFELFLCNNKRALIIMDETCGWQPPENWKGVFDLVIMPVGVVEFDPLTGARKISADANVLKTESTFEQVLSMVDVLQAKKTILSHVEEFDALSYDAWLTVEADQRLKGRNITIAFDGLQLTL